MSTFQRLTLIGLYNHYPELFKNLTLPAAYHAETFVDVLLLDQGEKRVAYPEPEFFSFAVGVWSRKWAASLERIALAMTTEYNPLHNYDRFEEWTDKESGEYENNVTAGGEDETKNTGTITTTETGSTTEQTNNMTTEKTVAAYNSNAYQPDEKNTVNGSVVTSPNTTQTVTPNTTETVKRGTTEDGSGNDKREAEHKGHMYGNIGVTTSVQMLTAEVDARKAYNMYAIAAELFADDLLLMLY